MEVKRIDPYYPDLVLKVSGDALWIKQGGDSIAISSPDTVTDLIRFLMPARDLMKEVKK